MDIFYKAALILGMLSMFYAYMSTWNIFDIIYSPSHALVLGGRKKFYFDLVFDIWIELS